MVKVELDPETRTKLAGVTDHVELCDETGRTVGHFLSTKEYENLVYSALAKEGPHSAEELRRRRHEPSGRPLSEIWRDWGHYELKYSVEWLQSAEQDLANLWNHARDRAAVTAAADGIDKALSNNPGDFGESRNGNTRIAFLRPLAVRFDVDEAARVVRVWIFGDGQPN